MTKRMLIDAAHPEETRVVIVDSNRVEELDFESRHKRQLRGNVYLARVTRVEPSLQAAFIEYGGNRHGFLAFSEIHPDYYRIPEADKLALKEQEEEDQRHAEEEDERRKAAASSRKSRTKRDEDEDESEEDEEDALEDEDEEEEEERDENLDPDDDDATDESDAEVADEQVNVAVKRRKRISRRRYKIQEVIKRGQILLVQAVKEERGNKGAAMTTYLSLAGRYCVLMPNTPRGGGISRKIANGSDRKRLKTIMNGLEVPKGMGVIVRTAGAKQTKTEITRDYEYLSRLWSEIRETTMESSAPALIHEEGNLVKRSIRDLYNKDIEEVLVQGNDAYDTASAFINMLMPSHAENVKHYDEEIPLFLRYGAEKQIENSLDATVQLKSGGYLVIHPTEALVSVDVNSGRSTKERNIERTALRTNMEAAEELARQMRLRDLAGLIVVDFIDMDENKNNRAVERKMKEMLSQDRARIQTSRISQFGLMEISRQRRRRSLLEGSTTSCPHCSGVGRKRTVESSALAAIRAVEEFAVRGKAKRIRLKTSPDVALYLLNEKRDLLTQVDQVADVFTEVVGDDEYIRPHYELEVIEKREDKRADPLLKIEREFKKEQEESKRRPKKAKAETVEDESDNEDTSTSEEDGDEESRKSGRRRSRRGRRGGRGRGRRDDKPKSEESDTDETENTESKSDAETSKTDSNDKPRRGRGRRRNAPSRSGETTSDKSTSEDVKSDEVKTEETAPKRGRRRRAPSKTKDAPVAETAVEETVTAKDDKPVRRSTTRRKAPTREKSGSAETTDAPKRTRKAPAKKASETAETETAKPARKRRAPARKPASDAKETTAKSSPATTRTRKAPAKKAEDTEAKPTRTRKAPAKKAKADAPEAKPTRTRKAPVKKAPTKKAPVKEEASKPTRTRKAPTKTASKTESETDAKPKRTRKAPAKTAAKAEPDAKPKRTRKAPAKKATTPAVDAAEKPKRTRKAPVKKAEADAPKAAAKPKAARKAPAKKAAIETAAKPAATRKAPAKPKPEPKPEPKAEPKPIAAKPAPAKPAPVKTAAPTAPEKKAKKGWWNRLKKD